MRYRDYFSFLRGTLGLAVAFASPAAAVAGSTVEPPGRVAVQALVGARDELSAPLLGHMSDFGRAPWVGGLKELGELATRPVDGADRSRIEAARVALALITRPDELARLSSFLRPDKDMGGRAVKVELSPGDVTTMPLHAVVGGFMNGVGSIRERAAHDSEMADELKKWSEIVGSFDRREAMRTAEKLDALYNGSMRPGREAKVLADVDAAVSAASAAVDEDAGNADEKSRRLLDQGLAGVGLNELRSLRQSMEARLGQASDLEDASDSPDAHAGLLDGWRPAALSPRPSAVTPEEFAAAVAALRDARGPGVLGIEVPARVVRSYVAAHPHAPAVARFVLDAPTRKSLEWKEEGSLPFVSNARLLKESLEELAPLRAVLRREALRFWRLPGALLALSVIGGAVLIPMLAFAVLAIMLLYAGALHVDGLRSPLAAYTLGLSERPTEEEKRKLAEYLKAVEKA